MRLYAVVEAGDPEAIDVYLIAAAASVPVRRQPPASVGFASSSHAPTNAPGRRVMLV
jgi:hypothetical protein